MSSSFDSISKDDDDDALGDDEHMTILELQKPTIILNPKADEEKVTPHEVVTNTY